ncbi:MAG: LETM1-related biofilm-associated protein [Flavobacterium sp.]
MINPSATGWVEKYFLIRQQHSIPKPVSSEVFYHFTRRTGFIYGHIISFLSGIPISTNRWLKDEISKVALLDVLYELHRMIKEDSSKELFLTDVHEFYGQMNPQGQNFFKKMLPAAKLTSSLEEIIDRRVQTNEDIVSRNFSHIITNALLFMDVLAFLKFLKKGNLPEKYIKKTEEVVVSIVTLALKVKPQKTPYDDLLVKLFEASVRYNKFSDKSKVSDLEAMDLGYFTNELEHYYFIDMAGMALWNDGKIDVAEEYFLYAIAKIVGVSDDFVLNSLSETSSFILLNKKSIPYFNYSNPVRHFYDQMSVNVITLIRRNKSRLAKEIANSGELATLLAKSVYKDLDTKEKKKVKKQLLAICKTIPSLTIFLLPGGSLLLPILIKFIPQLLPSTFNENSESEF